MSTMVEETLAFIDDSLDTYIFDSYQSLSSALVTPFWLAVTVWCIIYGYMIMKQTIHPKPEDLINNLMKITISYILVAEWGLINELLVNTVTNGPSALIGSLTSSSGESVYASLGKVSEQVLEASGKGYDADGIVNSFVAGTTILVSGLFAVLYAFFLIMVSKLALAVLLALTPLFGLFYIFKGSAKMLETWLIQLMNFALLAVLTVATLTLMTSVFEQALSLIPENEDELTLAKCLGLILVGVGSFLTLMQIRSLASAIAGGVALSTFGAYGSAVRTGQGAIASGGRMAGSKVSSGVSSVRNKISNPAGRIKSQ